MEKELYYSTVDLANNKAVMRLYGEIGYEINGIAFNDELLYIESLGITDIDIYINSGGGNVYEAYTIFTSLTKSKSNITTYNYGIAASAASWLFLAGKQCVAADYSYLMVHNPSSPDTSKKGQEVVSLMRTSIITILSKRTGISAKKIGVMMDEETWIDSTQALKMGFATSIEETARIIELEPAMQTANVMYAICNSVINKKEIDMTEDKVETTTDEITNDTVEAAVVEANVEIDEITNTVDVEVTDTVENTEVIEVDNKVDILNTYVTRIAELEAEIATLKAAENERIETEKEKVSVELVSNAINVGKIKAEAKAEWVAMAKNNYTLAKTTLDAIVVNKTGLDVKKLLNKSTDTTKLTFKELEKDFKKVQDVYFNNPELYNQLYFEEFGKYPATRKD